MTQSLLMKSIELLLPTGSPSDMRIGKFKHVGRVEILGFPREHLPDLTPMTDKHVGVYFLIKESDDRSFTRSDGTVYVGTSTNIPQRLAVHRTKEEMDFWEDTVVITSNTKDSFEQGHLDLLEKYSIGEISKAKRYFLKNKQKVKNKGDLNDSLASGMLEAECKTFFGEVCTLIPALGFRLFTPLEFDLFRCSVGKADARMRRISDEKFVVLESSIVSPDVSKDAESVRSELQTSGAIVGKDGVLMFIRDESFSSPNKAGMAVLGGTCNAKKVWKRSDGKTYGEVYPS